MNATMWVQANRIGRHWVCAIFQFDQDYFGLSARLSYAHCKLLLFYSNSIPLITAQFVHTQRCDSTQSICDQIVNQIWVSVRHADNDPIRLNLKFWIWNIDQQYIPHCPIRSPPLQSDLRCGRSIHSRSALPAPPSSLEIYLNLVLKGVPHTNFGHFVMLPWLAPPDLQSVFLYVDWGPSDLHGTILLVQQCATFKSTLLNLQQMGLADSDQQ